MGVYLNPDKTAFEEAVRSKIYVDKTGLIQYTNGVIETTQKYICVSRPRRFGKSIAANMLIAYYSKGCDSSALFKNYQISKGDEKDTAYHRYLNKYDVIFLNMQDFLSDNGNIKDMPGLIEKRVIRELLKQYTDVDYADKENLSEILKSINSESGYKFVFVIDEWDCIFREKKMI